MGSIVGCAAIKTFAAGIAGFAALNPGRRIVSIRSTSVAAKTRNPGRSRRPCRGSSSTASAAFSPTFVL
jgi:hypothetical protein